MSLDSPRVRRLRADHERMIEIKGRSDFIDLDVIDQVPGMPPEKYIVRYSCSGIIGIDAEQQPIIGNDHKVVIYLDEDYPMAPPKMRWVTPIWHPNIQHREPFGVCIDPRWWAAGRTLDRVVIMIGEMVQYKNYHADDSPPYPFDHEVAMWAKWAESQGIIGKHKPIDSRELLRPERIRVATEASPRPHRIRVEPPPARPKVRIVP